MLKKHKNACTIYTISQYVHDKGWNPSSCKTITYLFNIANIMGADVLATQGARTSATMILTMLNRNNSVPAPKSFACLDAALTNEYNYSCNENTPLFKVVDQYWSACYVESTLRVFTMIQIQYGGLKFRSMRLKSVYICLIHSTISISFKILLKSGQMVHVDMNC